MMKLAIAAFLATLITPTCSLAQVAPTNLITVGAGCENGKQGWTASGGTFSSTSSAANVGEGKVACSFDASASSQTVTSAQYTVKAGLFGRNCMGKLLYKGGDANLKLQVIDGSSNVLAEQVLSPQSSYKQETVSFVCPSSGTLAMRVASTADAAVVYLDGQYIGENYLVGTAAQAEVYGQAIWQAAASCAWSSASGSYVSYSADADCATPSGSNLRGHASAPATKIPAISFASLPPGEYEITITGTFRPDTGSCAYRLYDGTHSYEVEIGASTAAGFVREPVIAAHFSVNAAMSNVTMEIQAETISGTPTCFIDAYTVPLVFTVKRFPATSEQVFKPGVDDWRVDATITGGGNISLGTSDITTYQGMPRSDLTLANNSVDGMIPAQIACDGTTESSGTTCSGADEQNAISFTLPKAGTVKACATFSHYADVTSGTAFPVFKMVETGNANQTIAQGGLESVSAGTSSASVASDQVRSPVKICSKFQFSSAGKKTIRIFYVGTFNGTVTTNVVLADGGSGASGGRNIHWTVEPDTQQVPAPYLVNSISTGSPGQDRINRAQVTSTCASDPCTIASQSGSWLTSITRNGTGDYTLNIASGVYSSTPTCVFVNNAYQSSTDPSTDTATSVRFYTFNASGTQVNANFNILCMGPR